MSKLFKKLEENTQSFKAKYLIEVEKWAQSDFEVSKNRSEWGRIEWCKFLGIEPRYVNDPCFNETQVRFPDHFYNTKASRVYDREQTKARRIVSMGVEKHIEKEIKNAENHFHNSLLKLESRIIKKGLNESAIKIQSIHVDVNLEITLTDGNQTVRAFTIIASGAIQRPHYRYLIK